MHKILKFEFKANNSCFHRYILNRMSLPNMCNLSPLAGLKVAEIYLSCGWLGGWVGGWVAPQNGNNAIS